MSTIRVLDYLRRNAIALTALACSLLALGGGAYAAISLPRGSVGPQQLNHRSIGGYVRAWASINGIGQTLAASSRVQVLDTPPSGPLTIRWTGSFPRRQSACTAMATPSGGSGPTLWAVYQGAGKVMFLTSGGPYPDGISVALIC